MQLLRYTATVVFLALSSIPTISEAIEIVPTYSANLDEWQRGVIDLAIQSWETKFPASHCYKISIDFHYVDLGGKSPNKPTAPAGMDLTTGRLASGDWLTFGRASEYRQRSGDLTPQSAKVEFNSNEAIDWYVSTGGVPFADEIDFWTVALHEVAHAIGFTVGYTKFADHVSGGAGTRTYTCGSTTATMTPDSEGAHLDPVAYPDHLMKPGLAPGERTTGMKQLEIDMLNCPWEGLQCCQVSSTSLDFGPVVLTYHKDKTFTITNTGSTTLSGFVQVSGFDYSLPSGGGSYSLGESVVHTVTVRLSPSSLGQISGSVDTGNEFCNDVPCTGRGAISSSSVDETPGALSLLQSHPNPFGGVTVIRYGLPVANEVRLGIYDLKGRLVRTLTVGHEADGSGFADWDGRDERGLQIPAGVYFCRLEAGGQSEMLKIVYLK